MRRLDVQTPPPGHYRCTRFEFGDRWLFGVECEVQDCEVDPWGSREPFGSFWFWAGGRIIGNTDQAEQLIHAFGPLDQVISNSGNRRATDVPGTSFMDKLEFVIWVRFGEDVEFDAARWGNRDIQQCRQMDLTRFELIPRGASPFQDGWEGVLLEDGEKETLIWREWTGDFARSHELSLPIGEFSRVLALASDWFRRLRSVRAGDNNIAPEAKPRFVRRSEDAGFAGI